MESEPTAAHLQDVMLSKGKHLINSTLLKESLGVLFLFLLLSACKPEPPDPIVEPPQVQTGSVFILNEGNFQWGNASLDLYEPEEQVIKSGAFEAINQQPIGDVLQSMSIFEDRAYLVVNNSSKIEVIDPDSLTAKGTITGLASPRFFLGVSPTKAYVSDLYANVISILNLETQEVSGTISCPGWTEQMILVDEIAFVANVRQPFLYLVDSQADLLIDSIPIRVGGNRIVKDKDGMLWVACGEIISPDEMGALYRIDPSTKLVVDSFLFPQGEHASELTINGTGDQLYFLNGGVQKMSITDKELPASPLIPEEGGLFYGLGVDPVTEEIYIADAIDFVQRGVILRYRPPDILLHEFRAGIIPGRFCFQGP